jgi:hypothetical protein
MRDFIISEIRRLAASNGGAAPGEKKFIRATGIARSNWNGVHWLRWSEAVAEAGLLPNMWKQRTDRDEVLKALAGLCRRLRRLPIWAEVTMERRTDPAFPGPYSLAAHFGGIEKLASALRRLAVRDPAWADLLDYLPERAARPAPFDGRTRRGAGAEGLVYLLKSGRHFKIGQSEDIEGRFRKISLALPEPVTLVHAIRTDDPPGIENYWHRRFADKRANGEWFMLAGEDVRAFRRRRFQ